MLFMIWFLFNCLVNVFLFTGFHYRLVQLTSKTSYGNITAKGDNQPKFERSDSRGIVVVVVDASRRFLTDFSVEIE